MLGVTEFRALLSASALSTLGDQVTRIAVAVLVFEQTDSAFFAAATMACSFFTWLVGGPFLSALADRWRRKRLMIWCDVIRAGLVGCLAIPGLPLPLIFVLLILTGLLAPPFESAKSAVLPDILEGDSFLTGNTLQGAVRQGAMVLGFLLGGGLVALMSAEVALVVDAGTFVLSALLLSTLRARPAATPSGESLVRETMEGFLLVSRSSELRVLLGYGILGTIPLILPESLAVPIASSLGGGGATAGLLTASVPAGFLVGSYAVLRVPADRRNRLLPVLTGLACIPLLLSPLTGSTAVMAALWGISGAFSAAQLIANASYMLAAPPQARGRAFGVAVSLIMATQGTSVLAAGWAAEHMDPRAAVAGGGLLGLVLVIGLACSTAGHCGSPSTAPASDLAQDSADMCRITTG